MQLMTQKKLKLKKLAFLTGIALSLSSIFYQPEMMLSAERLYFQRGNVNGDNIISSEDALCILQNIVGTNNFDNSQKIYADFNNNGSVTPEDALKVLQYIVGSVDMDSKYNFRNDNLLSQYYTKHGAEMGFSSATDYEREASYVITSPYALYKTEKEDGDGVYYIEATNEFVILSTDGYIRTYFYPDSGKSYFDRQ